MMAYQVAISSGVYSTLGKDSPLREKKVMTTE